MPTLLHNAKTLIAILRDLGPKTIWHSLRYPLRYARWERAYAAPAGEGSRRFLGSLLRCESLRAGEDEGAITGADLHCEGGVLRLEFPAEGIVRVRLSQTGRFAPLRSFALTPELLARHPRALRLRYQDDHAGQGGPLVVDGPGLRVEVQPEPCRLTFRDTAGASLGADQDGAGWERGGVIYTRRLAAGEHLYGLGEKATGLDHRGQRFRLWNSDPSGYGPGDDPLYQSIPFLVHQRDGLAWGTFFDNTHRVALDCGAADPETLAYRAEGGELCYYVLAGPSMAQVLQRYAVLTGRAPLPARWVLGYHQSRWSYDTAERVREVAAELRRRQIPCDAIHADIDYMNGYRVFTLDRRRFPDARGLLADLRAEGFRLVTFVDPGVKADPHYRVCAEGLAGDYFCRLPDGEFFQGPVWPGLCYFPDFGQAAVRAWWGEQHRGLLDAGVAGFMNDMNEPAIFFGSTMPGAVQHCVDGEPVAHRALHNAYSLLMAQACAESLRRLAPEERPHLLCRSAYAGIQRYAGTWTGDNQSTWAHLRLTIPMILNMGLSGQILVGPDTGGFSGDCTGELLARWTQLSAFLPLFRNHTARGTADQEPYAFGEPYETICRHYIQLRYRLLPYLYTLFWQAAETGLPVARPLALHHAGDARVAAMDDEFLLGEALLVAPNMAPGSNTRPVYLPAGAWYDFWTDQCLSGPVDIQAEAPLARLPLYVRAGSVLPMEPVMQHTDEFIPERLELHLFPGNGESRLYEDDGRSFAYERGSRRITRFDMRMEEQGLVLTRDAQGDYDPGYLGYDIVLHGCAPEHHPGVKAGAVLVDGVPLRGWSQDAAWGRPHIAAGIFQRLEIRWP